MTPPVLVDEYGNRRPTRPCPHCGREAPVFRFRLEHLKFVGCRPYTVASFTNWCGHGQEFIPVPADNGWCWMIPVVGTA